MTKLSEIIDAAGDDGYTTTNLLRKVQTVAFRLRADNISSWVKSELFGYADEEPLPSYRGPFYTPVQGTWVNPARRITTAVSPVGVSEAIYNQWFQISIRQPVADLEELASSENNPGRDWDPYAVQQYGDLVDSGRGGAGFELMTLISARQSLPKNQVRGIIDAVRTTALQLALELEGVSPHAGEPGGPTTSDPEVQQVTNNFNFTINGDGNNVAAGSDIRQKSQVTKGDVGSLVDAAAAAGLQERGLEELRAAVLADGDTPAEKTSQFMEKFKAGAFAAGSGLGSALTPQILGALISSFFGVPLPS